MEQSEAKADSWIKEQQNLIRHFGESLKQRQIIAHFHRQLTQHDYVDKKKKKKKKKKISDGGP